MSLKSYTLLASTFILITTAVALATPRQDCETAINSLGYPLTGYVFEERGVFSMEKHHIGGGTCYICCDTQSSPSRSRSPAVRLARVRRWSNGRSAQRFRCAERIVHCGELGGIGRRWHVAER